MEVGQPVFIHLIRKPTLVPGMPTIGTLSAGPLTLYTLELPWLNNDPAVSCIPEGSYICPPAWSDRFQRLMPRLLYVPGRSGILFHPGNYAVDTRGCILLGRKFSPSAVYDSKGAFALFFDWLVRAWSHDPVAVTITHEGEFA